MKVSFANKRLAICTPAGNGQFCTQYLISLSQSIRLFYKHGLDYNIYVLEKCSILPHARNRLVMQFLESNATHMLFIDSDMGWPDYAPLELLAHDKDVIAAVGVTKDQENQKFCVTMDKDTMLYDEKKGIVRVKQVGTGFMMISRHCMTRMAEHYKDLAYKDGRVEGPPIPRWFENDLTNTDWGEDFTFCRRWREMGGEIWIDPSIKLEHVGQHVYSGTYSEALIDARRRSEAA